MAPPVMSIIDIENRIRARYSNLAQDVVQVKTYPFRNPFAVAPPAPWDVYGNPLLMRVGWRVHIPHEQGLPFFQHNFRTATL